MYQNLTLLHDILNLHSITNIMPRKSTKKSVSKLSYETNPFFIGAKGLSFLINSASGISLLFAVVSIANLVFTMLSNNKDGSFSRDLSASISRWTTSDWVLAAFSGLLIASAIVLVITLLGAMSAYTSYRVSLGKRVSVQEAFEMAFTKIWGFLLLQILITVRIILWTFVFIIPGFIMAYRYSLANVAYFDGRKKPNARQAIQESLRLTKGAWITTFASRILLDVLSFGCASLLISTGVNAVLYGQYDKLGSSNKPEAHWLSWLTLLLPLIIFVFIAIILFIGFIYGLNIEVYDK